MTSSSVRRILYVEGNVDGTIGGSYFSLLFLTSGLDRKRYEPVVVFAAHNDLLPRFRERNIRTEVIPPRQPTILSGAAGRLASKAINFIRGAILEPLALARLLRRERVALLHLNNSIVRNHSWMIAARLAGIPCITHERGINKQFKARDRRLARRLDAVICISAAVRDNFVAHGLDNLRLVTIHNGLNPAEMRVTRTPSEIRTELGIAPSARLIGIVGNIKLWKGQEVVIRAMADLSSEFPELMCLLIGDTSPDDVSYRTEIVEKIRHLGLQGRVLVTGFRKDVANFVNALEIQIHASIAPEPFGRVLLEGMALSKPLVASNGGAVPEIVVENGTGMLFEPGDSTALARCLRTLLQDATRARELGHRGRQRLETEFSITHNVHQTQALYDRLLEGSG